MRTESRQIFDRFIEGTGPWYTSANLVEVLGKSDVFAIQAVPTDLSTSPTLTVEAEESGDGQNWVSPSSPVIDGLTLQAGAAVAGGSSMTLSHLRFKLTMGSASDACRLKIFFTGRSLSVPAGGTAPARRPMRRM